MFTLAVQPFCTHTHTHTHARSNRVVVRPWSWRLSYPHGDDVAGAVHHGQTRVHQHLPQQLDVALVLAPQHHALRSLQRLDGLAGTGQQHGGQGGGEDEAGGEGAHGVHQGLGAGDVAADTAERFAWMEEERERERSLE